MFRSLWSRRATKVATALLVVTLAVTVLVRPRASEAEDPPDPTATCSTTPSPAGVYSLDPLQAQYATQIAAVAAKRELPARAVTIALATAMQESNLYNLQHGDRDSLGLFQQRPSQGWGTEEQITDPDYAINRFYDELVKVEGWQNKPINDVAQEVQRSGVPDGYAKWEGMARSFAQALTGQIPAGFTCRLAPPKNGSRTDEAAAALAGELGAPAVGVPIGEAPGWTAANWMVGHAHEYGLTSVRYAGRRWDRATGEWQADPTADAQVRL